MLDSQPACTPCSPATCPQTYPAAQICTLLSALFWFDIEIYFYITPLTLRKKGIEQFNFIKDFNKKSRYENLSPTKSIFETLRFYRCIAKIRTVGRIRCTKMHMFDIKFFFLYLLFLSQEVCHCLETLGSKSQCFDILQNGICKYLVRKAHEKLHCGFLNHCSFDLTTWH